MNFRLVLLVFSLLITALSLLPLYSLEFCAQLKHSIRLKGVQELCSL